MVGSWNLLVASTNMMWTDVFFIFLTDEDDEDDEDEEDDDEVAGDGDDLLHIFRDGVSSK